MLYFISNMKVYQLLLVGLAVLFLTPFLFLWSINTAFDLNFVMTAPRYVALLVLLLIVGFFKMSFTSSKTTTQTSRRF